MRYGLRELAHRDELLAEQNNACAICGVTGYTWGKGFNKRWHVDHDHNNPEPNHRGVLCERCNLVLGVLEKVGLTRFISYLEKYT
jgi:ribosomal protein S14